MKNLLYLKQTVFGLFLLLLLVASFSCSPYRKAANSVVPHIREIETDDSQPRSWGVYKTNAGLQLVTNYDKFSVVAYAKHLPLAKKVEITDAVGNTWMLQTFPKFVETAFGMSYAARTWVYRKDISGLKFNFVDTLITTECLASPGDIIILSKGTVLTVAECAGDDCTGIINAGTDDAHLGTINRRRLGELIVRKYVYNEK